MLTIKIFKVDNLTAGCYTVIVLTGNIQEGTEAMRQERLMMLEKHFLNCTDTGDG